MIRKTRLQVCALAMGLFLGIQLSTAHAILVESTPAANSTVLGPNVPVRLRFNSRIDASRSKLAVIHPDATTDSLKIAEQPSPDTLTSEAKGLKPGTHRIHWQVLATDGHMTRGDIPFTVAGN